MKGQSLETIVAATILLSRFIKKYLKYQMPEHNLMLQIIIGVIEKAETFFEQIRALEDATVEQSFCISLISCMSDIIAHFKADVNILGKIVSFLNLSEYLKLKLKSHFSYTA